MIAESKARLKALYEYVANPPYDRVTVGRLMEEAVDRMRKNERRALNRWLNRRSVKTRDEAIHWPGWWYLIPSWGRYYPGEYPGILRKPSCLWLGIPAGREAGRVTVARVGWIHTVDFVLNHPDYKQRVIEERTELGYVYLCEGQEGYYKIGLSVKPERRIKAIATDCPWPVTLLKTIPTENMYRAERFLHDRFADKRTTGEWFRLTEDDVDFITRLSFIGEDDYA